ncbi:uncharacterized protein LOC126972703 [Leptidea sinapis]|nr:uncharacterized protein LOC126972703 [Leptidea sinapis]
MMDSEPKKNIRRIARQESSGSKTRCKDTIESPERRFPLIAKDSEWVDISGTQAASSRGHAGQAGEHVQQSAPEEGEVKRVMTSMFPNLLDEDPETLDSIINSTISTTDVTRHLVGHKADFTFLKKVERLIPPDKKWLESVQENSNSLSSIDTRGHEDYQSCSTTDDSLTCSNIHYSSTKGFKMESNHKDSIEDYNNEQSTLR